MNFKKFFKLAKEAGIESCQLNCGETNTVSVSLFHHEIDSYTVMKDQGLVASGIYKGKFASCSTQKIDNSSFEFLINGIISNASISEKESNVGLFEGSKRYRKRKIKIKETNPEDIEKKIEMLKTIEKKLYAYSQEISEVQSVSYEESKTITQFYNSYGLKLKDGGTVASIVASVVAKRGEEIKTNYDYKFGEDVSDIDVDEFVKKIADEAIKQFGGQQCKAGKYPTLLSQGVFAQLLNYFLYANSSDEVQRNSSFLGGLEGKKVASSKLCIDEKPLLKGPLYSYFDAEGVARENKKIVNHGTLVTHFYNRETAKKAGKETTANGTLSGGKIGIGWTNIIVKPSKKTTEQLIGKIKNGVYITDIAGLGTGMNTNSGDFSCQAQGYMIKNGKEAEPVDLITLSGNLLTLLKDIKGFDDKYKLMPSGVGCSNVLVKSLHIGGK